MKNYVCCEDVANGETKYKWVLRNEICEVLANAGSEGMTPTELVEELWNRGWNDASLSLQRVTGNVRFLPSGLVERREVEDKEHTIKVITVNQVFTPLGNGLYECRPAGTKIEIPTKKVVYVWVG